jgi:hypothetical protein
VGGCTAAVRAFRTEERTHKIVEKLQTLGVAQKLDRIPQVELLNPQAALLDSGADIGKKKRSLI